MPGESARDFLRLSVAALGIWTILGAISFLQLYSSMVEGHHSVSLSRSVEIGVGNSWLKAALSLPVLWVLLRFNAVPRSLRLRASVYGFLLILFTAAHIALRPLLIPMIIIGADGSHYSYGQFLAADLQSFTLDDVLAFFLTALGFHAWRHAREARIRELREQTLRTRLATAELHMLKLQLQPHFLFNTLNSIYHLAPENGRKAQQMVERLSRLLRLSLDHVSTNLVELRRELDFLDAYLEIESTRFEERLHVVRDIDPDASHALVPNMILQPLVENAIQHGISKMAAGGTVRIRVARNGNRLSIVITNDCRGTNVPVKPSGLGLANTRARLTQVFQGDFSLDLKRTPALAQLTIDLPFVSAGSQTHSSEEAWARSQP